MEKERTSPWLILFRVVFTAALIACIMFIFRNSLENGAQSSARSQAVMQLVNSALAKVHLGPLSEHLIRKFAHFSEFALEGFLLMLCIRVYTKHFVRHMSWPLLGGMTTALMDETIQLHSLNRTSSVVDVWIDMSGVVAGLLFALIILLIVLLINSTYGRAFKAIRDDEIAAEAMGINLARHKMISFVVSSFFCGVAGAMLAMCNTSVSSVSFTTSMTYQILLVVVVGGIGSVSGSVIAAFIYYASSEWWLRFLDLETYTASGARVPLLGYGFRMVVFSVLIMIVVLFFRKGIMGTREVSVYDDIRKIGRFFTRKSAAKGGDVQ